MKDIMIDLETLGTRYNAAIIQIGACYFDRKTGQIGPTFKANVQYSFAMIDKFTVDYGTITWWFGQSEEARKSMLENSTDLITAISNLIHFLNIGGRDSVIWSHATFDMPILVNAFSTVNMSMPISFRNMRDIRTVTDLADHYSESPRVGTHHDSLDDAIFQAKYVSESIIVLKGENAKTTQNKDHS